MDYPVARSDRHEYNAPAIHLTSLDFQSVLDDGEMCFMKPHLAMTDDSHVLESYSSANNVSQHDDNDEEY